MTAKIDWEASARAQLEKVVADAVDRIRQSADQIEREARRNIANAAKAERGLEFQTYVRAAGQVVHEVQTLAFNLPLENLIDSAGDAEAAHTEKTARTTRDDLLNRAARNEQIQALASDAGTRVSELETGAREVAAIVIDALGLGGAMNAGQYEGLMATLGEIRDRPPAPGPGPPALAAERHVHHTEEPAP